MIPIPNHIRRLANIIRKQLDIPNKSPLTREMLEYLITSLDGKLDFQELNPDIIAQINKIDNNKFEIIINKNISEEDKSLKIAEELGHLFLHMGFITNDEQWSKNKKYTDSVYYRIGYSIEAYEANCFAKVLLNSKDYCKKEEAQQLSL